MKGTAGGQYGVVGGEEWQKELREYHESKDPEKEQPQEDFRMKSVRYGTCDLQQIEAIDRLIRETEERVRKETAEQTTRYIRHEILKLSARIPKEILAKIMDFLSDTKE